MEELLSNVLKSNGYLIINKILAKEIGLEASICLADLISKEEYFKNNNLLDKDGFFYNTRDNITKDTTLSAYQQRIAVNKLRDIGILDTKQKDIPKKMYYRINYLSVVKFLTTSDKKTSHQVVKKLNINNNKNNNKNNNIQSFQDSYQKFLDEYNTTLHRKTKSMEGWKKNAEFWLTVYSEEDILAAIREIPRDPFWKDKMDLTILFRRKNPQGESVDYIQKLLDKAESKKPKNFMIGGMSEV
jgi:DNA-binding transcriptional regulator GbsR (MarR family)